MEVGISAGTHPSSFPRRGLAWEPSSCWLLQPRESPGYSWTEIALLRELRPGPEYLYGKVNIPVAGLTARIGVQRKKGCCSEAAEERRCSRLHHASREAHTEKRTKNSSDSCSQTDRALRLVMPNGKWKPRKQKRGWRGLG